VITGATTLAPLLDELEELELLDSEPKMMDTLLLVIDKPAASVTMTV